MPFSVSDFVLCVFSKNSMYVKISPKSRHFTNAKNHILRRKQWRA